MLKKIEENGRGEVGWCSQRERREPYRSAGHLVFQKLFEPRAS